MIRMLRIGVAISCSLATNGQQLWKVSSSPTVGADFSDLPQAVVAAAPGDMIWVFSPVGAPNIYTAPTIDKPLTIIGFLIGAQPGNNVPGAVGLQGTMTIDNIPSDAKVVVTNTFMNSQTPIASSVLISDCAGSVVLDDFYFTCAGLVDRTVRIVNCSDVTLRGSEIDLGGEPLDIIGSNVLISSTLIEHIPALGFPFPGYTTTTETIFLQDSHLTISGSIVTAQNGKYLSGQFQPARNAVVLDNSTLRIGPTTLVRGGHIWGTSGTSPNTYAPACLLTGGGTNEVQHDPRSPVTNYGTVQPTVTWLHEVIHDWVVADELFHAMVIGPPGGFALLALGDYVPWSQAPSLGPIGGQLALDPLTAYPIDLVLLNPTHGRFEWTFLCPATALNGHAFALQALALSPSGAFDWTTPSPLTVGWDKDRIP